MPRGPLIFPSRDGGTQENAQILKINTNTQVHRKYSGKYTGNTKENAQMLKIIRILKYTGNTQEYTQEIHRKMLE